MKKLFTFFAAMALVAMSFAQLTEYRLANVPQTNIDRSQWIGFVSQSGSAFNIDPGSEYLLRIPAGTMTVGTTIDKVLFYHNVASNISGIPAGDPAANYNNDTYEIRIYTNNVHYIPTSYVNSQEEVVEYDSLCPGEPTYTQVYQATEVGNQEVTLNTPITVPAGDICIGIYVEDGSWACLCPSDPTCEQMSYLMVPDEGWWHYRFGPTGGPYEHKPFLLSVYNNDGAPQVFQSDIVCRIYDTEAAEEQTLFANNTYLVDEFTDSLYLTTGIFNMGPDNAMGKISVRGFFDNGTEMEIFDKQLGDTTFAEDTVQVQYGYIIPWGALIAISDLAAEGLQYPFDLCIEVTFTNAASPTTHIDPNPDNNRVCVTVTNQEDPGVGINENNNTLRVSPNPANTTIQVENVAGAQIAIYNIAGQQVMNIENANTNETINVSNLSEGVYVVRTVNGNQVATTKVSIVR